MNHDAVASDPNRPKFVHPDATPFRRPTAEESVLGMASGAPTLGAQQQQLGGGFGAAGGGVIAVPMQGVSMRDTNYRPPNMLTGGASSAPPPLSEAKIAEAIAMMKAQGIDPEKARAAINAAQQQAIGGGGGAAFGGAQPTPMMLAGGGGLPGNVPSFSFSTAGVAPLSLNMDDPKNATPQRRAEMLQRQLEFTTRLISDTERSALNARIAIGFEAMSFAAGAFLFGFGWRHADPTRGLLRSLAPTRPQLARLGSLYCMAGSFGMMMTCMFVPMEYQAVKNVDFALEQLRRTQKQTLQHRNELMQQISLQETSGAAGETKSEAKK